MINGVIKTVKTTEYAQIHNNPLQNLKDLKSIGLLSHLMSLPENWVIRKMQLFDRFGRGPVNTAFKELEENRYLFSIKCREGKKDVYGYFVSDVSFSDEQINKIIEQIELPIIEVRAKDFHCRFSTSQDKSGIITDFCDVDFGQSILDNPKQTPIKETVTKEINKKEILISSSSSRDEIDKNLKVEFSNKPFEEIQQNLLDDSTVIIETVAQYKSMLKYRLKNWKPSLQKKQYQSKKSARIEIVPEWYGKDKKNDSQIENATVVTEQDRIALQKELGII